MTPEIISLIITLIAAVLIVLPVIWGAIRGLKKSAFRFLWIIGFGILCFFLSGIIAKALVGIDYSFLNITFSGHKITTLPKFIEQTLQSSNPDIADMIADNPNMINLCVSLATMVLRVIVFELMFWLTKWLLWPIWAIISHCLYGKKKAKKMTAEEERESHIMQKPGSTALVYNTSHTNAPKTKEVAVKKRAGLGALIGLAMGIFVLICTFVPFVGINNVIMQINTEIQVDKGDGTTEGILDNRLGSNAVYLNVFNDSIIGQALKYTGIAAVQTSMCSYLTTSTFEGNSISLSAEVSALIPVYKDYVQVQSYDYSNLTKADITELLSLADDLQNRILSSNLVDSVYNELMPYLAKNILTNDNYFIRIPSLGDESRDAIVKNVLKNFAGLNDSYEYDSSKLVSLADIKHDISKGISMAGKVNGANLLLAFINNQLTLEVVQENISVELGEQVLDDLLAMKTLQRLMPDVVEPAVEEVIKMIPATKDRDNNDVSVEYVALDDGLDYDNFKQYLRRFVRNAILVVKDIEMESPLYIQGKNFANLGTIIDGLKTDEIVSEATFNSVVNYLMAVADKRVSEMTLRTEFDNIATAIVQTLDEIESFQTELGHFGDAYQKYLDSENGVTAQLVFEMLDDVKSTTLYTENIDTIIANGTTYLTTMITENNLPLATDNLGTILNKIKQVTSFADEYDKIESLYAYIDEKLIQGSVDDLLKEEVLVGLGEKLDDTIDAGSKLIDDENCKILIKNVIEKIELPTELADKKAQIKTNVELIESYEAELTAVAKALKISDISSDTTLTDRQKIVRLGAIIDEVKTSNLFGNVAVAVVKDYANAEIDKNTTLSANIVTTVKNAVNAITVGLTFENEFGYMYDLVNGADFDSISNFKTYLSDNLINTDGSSKSGIITREVLYDLIIEMVDGFEIDGLDISTEVVSCLTADKADPTVSIIVVLDDIDELKAEVEDIANNIPAEADINRTYLANLGAQIDGFADYSLILNANAVKSIGDHITDKLYNSLSAETKSAIQTTYNNKNNYATFAALYAAFADDLGL